MRLTKLLQIKIDQLQSLLRSSEPSRRSELQQQLSEVQRAVVSAKDINAVIESDPAWLHMLPNAEGSAWLAILMGVGMGMLCGLLNGLLIVILRVVPFIATLGTMTVFLGVAKIVADESAVRPNAKQCPQWLGELAAVRPDPTWLLVSKGVWLCAISGSHSCLRFAVHRFRSPCICDWFQ